MACACAIRSRRRAAILYTLALVLVTGLVAAVPFVNLPLAAVMCVAIFALDVKLNCFDGGGGGGAAAATTGATAAHGGDGTTAADVKQGMRQEHAAPPSAAALPPPAGTAEPLLPAAAAAPVPQSAALGGPPGPARLPFLDNLKTALTALVVVHHATCAFTGRGSLGVSIGAFRNPFALAGGLFCALNQSYFMALFFFISGYFTPRSYERKGPRRFLRDRLKRLGRPLLVYAIGLGPGLGALAAVARRPPSVDHRYSYSYAPDPGPCWFLFWLLIFNGSYALVRDGAPPGHLALRAPSLLRLCGLGAALGVAQAGQMVAAANVLMMPISFGAMPFDAVFFVGGVAAWHGRWLEVALPRAPPSARVAARVVVAAIVALLVAGAAVVYATNTDIKLLPTRACRPRAGAGGSLDDDDGSRGGNDSSSGGHKLGVAQLAVLTVTMGVLFGVFAMAFSYAVLDAFREHLNHTGKRALALARASYAVYLCHPFVVVPLSMAYVGALRAAGVSDLHFAHGSQSSPSCLSSDAYLWLGCAALCVLSLLLAFPLGAALRRAPGLREVL